MRTRMPSVQLKAQVVTWWPKLVKIEEDRSDRFADWLDRSSLLQSEFILVRNSRNFRNRLLLVC
jgi:hypothetical protein